MKDHEKKPDFKRQSVTGSLITGVGLILMIGAFVAFMVLAQKQSKEIAFKTDSLAVNEAKTAEFKEELVHVEKEFLAAKMSDSIAQLLRQRSMSNTPEAGNKSIPPNLIQCEAVQLDEKFVSGKEKYNFTFYLKDASIVTQLKSVTYFFDHPSFSKQRVSTFDSDNNFSYTYTGWGCLENVKVTLSFHDNHVVTVDFAMCSNLKVKINPESKLVEERILKNRSKN